MTGMRAFFNTNVVVYALTQADMRKHLIADGLVQQHARAHTMVLSTQVLQESYNVLLNKMHLPVDQVLQAVTGMAEREVVPANAESVLRGLWLAARYRLSTWDGLIVQAALDAACDVLLTEDLQPGMRFGKLEVVNPFTPGAHEAVAAVVAAGRRRPGRPPKRST